MLPSKNITTHFAEINKENKRIPLTIEQAEGLREILKTTTSTKYISIPDPNNPLGEPLWEGRAGSITIVKANADKHIGARYICDYATKHQINENCNCMEKYKVYPIQFSKRSYELFKKLPQYLTEQEMYKVKTSFTTNI